MEDFEIEDEQYGIHFSSIMPDNLRTKEYEEREEARRAKELEHQQEVIMDRSNPNR